MCVWRFGNEIVGSGLPTSIDIQQTILLVPKHFGPVDILVHLSRQNQSAISGHKLRLLHRRTVIF